MREPRPITHVEVSEKNRKVRIIAAVVLLVIGAAALASGLIQFLNKDVGWQRVEITTDQRNCSESFILQYNFSGSGAQKKALNNQLEAIFADGCVKGYQLFTPDESIDDVQNIYYVNHHINEVITVDPLLYASFEKLADTPYLYLGPVYSCYNNIIFNVEPTQITDLDPLVSDEAADYVAKIAAFANDRSAINLELLGNNQVKLYVSDAYMAFAEDEEIETFIDFGYMTNAFVIDYLADQLKANGLTEGYLASADGYTRNLDSKNTFSFNIIDRLDEIVCNAAAMQYRGPISMVYLKNYPTAVSDANYRATDNGFVHLLADPVDGIYRTAADNLVSYSYEESCVDVMLKMLPNFIGDTFSVPEGVFSVWCEGTTICYNDEAVTFSNLLTSGEVSYGPQLRT